MKILFAVDPWIYRDCVGEQMFTITNIFLETINNLLKFGDDVQLLIGEDTKFCFQKREIYPACKVITIELKELYSVFKNHYLAHKIQYNKEETAEEKQKLKDIIVGKFDEWIPDVVISFTTPASVWKYIFPSAMSLQFENGIFSRSPYPYTCQLDPFGFLSNSYPAVFCTELRNHNLTRDEMNRIVKFKNEYMDIIFARKNPIERSDLGNQDFEKTLLVPLSYNGVIINDAASEYASQLDFLNHVLENVPNTIRIIATRHSLQRNGSIPQETEEFLLAKYPNLSFAYNLEKYMFLSQWLTPIVDGVISLNSTVAFHAALLGKKVFALGKCEINSIADSETLDGCEDILDSDPESTDQYKLNVLYQLLTRHSFPLSNFKNGEWLHKRLEKMLKVHEDGSLYSSFSALPKIHDNDDLIFSELMNNTPGLAIDFKPRIK